MRDSNRLKAAAYGVAFHAVAVIIMLGLALKNRAPLEAGVLIRAIPALLASAAVLYFFIVGPYLPSRSLRKAVVFADSAIGMLVECAVVALTSFLYALLVTLPALPGGLGTFASAFASTASFTLLWMFASFFVQILVIGNAAGLVGWFVLKKLAERAAAAAARHDPAKPDAAA